MGGEQGERERGLMGGEGGGGVAPENAICERGAPEHTVASEVGQNALFENTSHTKMRGERGNERRARK